MDNINNYIWIINILIEKLEEKRDHYSGPLSASDWIDILGEVKDEIKKQVIYEPIMPDLEEDY